MCTVSWKFRPEGTGYDLWFNRDESRKRSRALPPAIHHPEGATPFLAPTDPDGGGTWLATDQHGTTTAILNYYDAAPPSSHPDPESRGKLVTALASREIDLGRMEPADYRPFHLLQINSAQQTILLTWNGTDLQERTLPQLLTTSSYKTAEVIAFRETAFARIGDAAQFHGFHDPGYPAHSPLMARPDARTVSVLHVEVAREVATHYYSEPTSDHPAIRNKADHFTSFPILPPVAAESFDERDGG